MRYLLDTCTISDFLRKNPEIVKKITRTPADYIAISTITKFEIAYGLNKKPTLAGKYNPILQELYAKTEDLVFDSVAAMVAGKIKHDLITSGKTIGLPDVMISAIALKHNLTVVTSNVKHFSLVENLKIENWKIL